jgi:hypothetical protein
MIAAVRVSLPPPAKYDWQGVCVQLPGEKSAANTNDLTA